MKQMTRMISGGRKEGPPGFAVCGLLALIAGLASFLPYMILTKGFFTLAEDYNQQQIPFMAAMYEGLKALPEGEWVWNLDLGASLITGFGYYNLGSPFTWLTLLFSKGSLPYLAVYLEVLKYVLAAETAYFWLRQFVRNDTGAVIGGLLYAFSGFQTTNLLFHFHDAIAFFPLLLLGMDRMTEGKGTLLFSFSVFLNCLVNYVFFVQEVVFSVIYFLFRNMEKGTLAGTLKTGLKVFSCAAVGVLMAAAVFVPNVIYLLNSPRGNSELDWSEMLYGWKSILFLLKGFLFPGEAMREQSAIFPNHFLSASAYVPFFGMSFVILYLLENRGWLKKLLITLILVSFSPLLQSGFLMFTETFQRWWYMLNLMLVLATVLVFDRKQFQTPGAGKTLLICSGGVAVFCAVIWKAPWVPGGTLVISRELFFLYGGMALAGSALCAGVVILKRLNGRTAVAFTMAACILTTGATIGVYRRSVRFADYTKPDYQFGMTLATPDEQYRYREVNNLYTLPGQGAGVGSFSSCKENSSYRFQQLFELSSPFDAQTLEVRGLPELLGGKYVVTSKTDEGMRGELTEIDGVFYGITECAACPVGFAVSSFITPEELKQYDFDRRAFVLMEAAVVDSPELVDGFAERYRNDENETVHPAELIRRTEEKKVRGFKRDRQGFVCETDYDQDQLVFFSVPNDPGWTARVDQRDAEIIDSCGMMVLRVPKGSHQIEFVYHTPGFLQGLLISLAGWMIFLMTAWIRHRRRQKAGSEAAGSAV